MIGQRVMLLLLLCVVHTQRHPHSVSHDVSFLVTCHSSYLIVSDRDTNLAKYLAMGCGTNGDTFAKILGNMTAPCASVVGYITNNATTTCASVCASTLYKCVLGEAGCHSGGNISLVFFSVIIGAMAIGQASPSLEVR